MAAGARTLLRILGVWLLAACAAAAACGDAEAPRATPPHEASRDAAPSVTPGNSGRASGPASAGAASGPATSAQSSSSPRGEGAGGEGRRASARRDLDADERCGGHTLARHVGWTDQQLADRLRTQRDIAAASTYTDRDTAERVIGAALAAESERVRRWTARHGRRPNITLRYRAPGDLPIGRSMRRGTEKSVPAFDALVVLRWHEDRDDFCVLTSYPEVRR